MIRPYLRFVYEGRRLPFRAFEEPRRVTQGDIVANKWLSAALMKIQADQRERDQEMLASPRVSRHRKQQVRAAQAQSDAPDAWSSGRGGLHDGAGGYE